jgi:hypothetical protein
MEPERQRSQDVYLDLISFDVYDASALQRLMAFKGGKAMRIYMPERKLDIALAP